MVSAFQVFKIIFGIIISIFVLIMVLRISNSFMQINETENGVKNLYRLKKSIDDTYTTGISSELVLGNPVTAYFPPTIIYKQGSVNINVPLILYPSQRYVLKRNVIDFAWWRFYYVVSIPPTRVIFIPLNKTEKVKQAMIDILNDFPDTEAMKNKVVFGFACNRTDVFIMNTWYRDYFRDNIIPYVYYSGDIEKLNDCKIKSDFVITVSEDETNFMNKENGVMVIPKGNNTGIVFHGNKKYFYINSADILALLFGGAKTYKYVNKVFLKQAKIAANLKIKEINILMPHSNIICRQFMNKFSNELNKISGIDESTTTSNMALVSKYMLDTKNMYEDMKVMGCV